jgi:hypothetical protein
LLLPAARKLRENFRKKERKRERERFYTLNHNEEHTTEMEKKVIAPPAAQEGSRSAKYGNKMPAARGIARMLYPIANTNSI